MRILYKTDDNPLARVYVGDFGNNNLVEFVESIPSPYSKDEKWVIILSTLFGCPIKCKMCDAGGEYRGKLTEKQIFSQIDYLVDRDFPNRNINVMKFKLQFARMGEPALNMAVLDVIEKLPYRYNAPGMTVSLSTIAPKGTDAFFDRLLEIRKKHFIERDFQLQFSLHTSDETQKKSIIPVDTWSFSKIAYYAKQFYNKKNRKITLNFALSQDSNFEPRSLSSIFDPEIFILKITPINPTEMVKKNNVCSLITKGKPDKMLINKLEDSGFEYIISIGDLEENNIGSNCGQFVSRLKTLSAVN